MNVNRRQVVVGIAAGAALGAFGCAHLLKEGHVMHGVINKIKAAPGKQGELAKLMLEGVDSIAGCLVYIVSVDASDAELLWVIEVWENEKSQQASLTVPAIRTAIDKAMPLIVHFESIAMTKPIGGMGLEKAFN